MESAMSRFGYKPARDILHSTLKDLSERYTDTYFTAGYICFKVEQRALENEQPTETERTETIRKTFSKRNITKILEENLSLDIISIQVWCKQGIETAYRQNLPNSKPSQPTSTQ